MRGAAAAMMALAALGGCGGDGSTQPVGSCGAVVTERLDPGSTRHLLPDAPEPTYATDPPTSGPHAVGGLPAGVHDEPLPRPVQVAVLEAGHVLIQYRDPGSRVDLEGLADEHVVIAPNPGLSNRVVATAWRHKLVCRGVDLEALRLFVDARRDRGPGRD